MLVREVAGVRSASRKLLRAALPKGEIGRRGHYWAVLAMTPYVLVCNKHTHGIALVDGIQANQLRGGQLAAYAKIITGIARENSYSICSSSGILPEGERSSGPRCLRTPL